MKELKTDVQLMPKSHHYKYYRCR